MQFKNLLEKYGADILTGLGIAGVAGTAVCAIYDTKKQQKKEVPKPTTFFGKVKTYAANYIHTIAVGGATVGCLLGARGLSKSTERRLIGALASAEGLYHGYRQTAKDILGPGTDEFIEKNRKQEKQDIADGLPPWDQKQTFYLDLPEELNVKPVFFEMTKYEEKCCEYNYNRLLAIKKQTTVNDLLRCFGLDPLPDKTGANRIGHDLYIGETEYGYDFVDFYPKQIPNGDMLIWAIEMPFAPHSLEEEY